MVIVLLYSCAAVRKQNVKIVLVRNKDKLELLQILCIRHNSYAHLLFNGPLHIGLGVSHLHSA